MNFSSLHRVPHIQLKMRCAPSIFCYVFFLFISLYACVCVCVAFNFHNIRLPCVYVRACVRFQCIQIYEINTIHAHTPTNTIIHAYCVVLCKAARFFSYVVAENLYRMWHKYHWKMSTDVPNTKMLPMLLLLLLLLLWPFISLSLLNKLISLYNCPRFRFFNVFITLESSFFPLWLLLFSVALLFKLLLSEKTYFIMIIILYCLVGSAVFLQSFF